MLAFALRLVGLGAITAAVSEVWFYPVSLDLHLLGLCLFYGPMAYFGWLVMAQTGAWGLAAAWWAACLFGFVAEGVVVPVLYTAMPFTILWTSMAWHALITIGVGLYLFRQSMARMGVVGQAIFSVLFGAYLGLWSVEIWSVPEDGASWTWQPVTAYWQQMLLGWVMFVVGHMLLDAAARYTVVPGKWEIWTVGGVLAAMWAIGQAVPYFPLSLVLPLLVALGWWLVARRGALGTPSPILARLSNWKVPIVGYMVSLLIPLSATGIYATLLAADAQAESSALHILWAGPLSILWLGWSAVRLLRFRTRPGA